MKFNKECKECLKLNTIVNSMFSLSNLNLVSLFREIMLSVIVFVVLFLYFISQDKNEKCLLNAALGDILNIKCCCNDSLLNSNWNGNKSLKTNTNLKLCYEYIHSFLLDWIK